MLIWQQKKRLFIQINQSSAKHWLKAVERAGYDVPKAAPVELSIEGMTCASCVARVEKPLKSRRCSTSYGQLSNRAGLGTSRCIS